LTGRYNPLLNLWRLQGGDQRCLEQSHIRRCRHGLSTRKEYLSQFGLLDQIKVKFFTASKSSEKSPDPEWGCKPTV
jgi:hypothetical protein